MTIVVHPRNDPDAKSEVFMLEHASREFVSQVSAEARRRDKCVPTSLELPKPRKILKEWSLEKGWIVGGEDDEKAEAGKPPAALMDANPRISPQNTMLR